MAKALTDIKHNGETFAAGEEVTGLSAEEELALRESGALEAEDGDSDEEDDEDEDAE